MRTVQKSRYPIKNRIVSAIIVLAILTAICFVCRKEFNALVYLNQSTDIINVINFEPLSNVQAKEVFNANSNANDNMQMCFVSDADKCQIESTSIEKFAETELVYVYGNINLLFPDMSYLKSVSDNFCIIDTTTAYELYGHTDVIGMRVIANNKNFTICNVVDSQQQFILVSDIENKYLQYDQLLININGRSSKIISNKLSVVYGIKGDVICYGIISFLPLCLIAVMSIILVVLLIIKIRKPTILNTKYGYIFKEASLFIAFTGIALILIFFAERCPLDFIPTQWSAFDEWSVIIQTVKNNFKLLLVKNMLFIEYDYVSQLFKSIVSAFTIFIMILLIKNYLCKKIAYIFDLKL